MIRKWISEAFGAETEPEPEFEAGESASSPFQRRRSALSRRRMTSETDAPPPDVTRLLVAWRDSKGDRAAYDDLVRVLYPELRRLAHQVRSRDVAASYQPTELLHEAYVRLIDQSQVAWRDRRHFLAVAARQMRRLLIEDWRHRTAHKRGGGLVISVADADEHRAAETFDAGAVAAALERLEQVSPRSAAVVELRFLAGLDVNEAADALGISAATVKREWSYARAWLLREMQREG